MVESLVTTDRTRRTSFVLLIGAVLTITLAVSVFAVKSVFRLQDEQTSTGEVVTIVLAQQLTLLGVLLPIVLVGRRFLRRLDSRGARIVVHAGSLMLLVVVATAARWGVARAFGVPLPDHLANTFLVGSIGRAVVAYVAACILFRLLDKDRELATERAAAERLAARERELRAEVTSARLEALLRRLEPHFLFNAMNAIGGLILTASAERAHDALTRLSSLLRHVLTHSEAPTVPLHSEIASVGDYLAIEQLRFGERMVVDLSCDEDCEDAEVPAMLLLPVVENAVRHGVARRSGASEVTVTAVRVEDRLQIEVRDEGGPVGTDSEPGFGIGLATSRERLRTMYGTGASLELLELPGDAGMRVSIELPWTVVTAASSAVAG